MFLQKKVDRAFQWLKEKNDSRNELNPDVEEERIELEKGDVLAIIISALLVFGPIFLFLILIIMWLL